MAQPIATTRFLCARTGLSAATVNKALANLARIGVVQEFTQKKRNRVFTYHALITILNEGTELP